MGSPGVVQGRDGGNGSVGGRERARESGRAAGVEVRLLKFWIASLVRRRPFLLERKVLALLAARYSLRTPFEDAPPYASSEDSQAPYGLLNRSGMIALAFRFMYGNIMTGDYFEFGCGGGRTFRMAWEHHKRHFNGRIHFWLCDSFKGLPPLKPIDEHPKWKAGDFSTPLDTFVGITDKARIPREAYTIIPGYYEETLTGELAQELSARGVRAGIVYIDCDLYESTRRVLEFVHLLFQRGTVICFDDFYCFNGDPDRGEQRAMQEFLRDHRDIRFVEYANFGWHGKSFLVHLRDGVGKQ